MKRMRMMMREMGMAGVMKVGDIFINWIML